MKKNVSEGQGNKQNAVIRVIKKFESTGSVLNQGPTLYKEYLNDDKSQQLRTWNIIESIVHSRSSDTWSMLHYKETNFFRNTVAAKNVSNGQCEANQMISVS